MNKLLSENNVIKILESIVFWYPYVMSLVWIAGSIIFVKYREKGSKLDINAYKWPGISILLPCYNEAETVTETISYLSKLSYPEFEIIAVNDGSSDNTGKILKKLSVIHKKLRVIDCKENRGKANALHIAAHASRYEYFVCIDSDAILDDMAPYYLIRHFIEKGERVGAVTGNPRIRNRDTTLGKLQIVEYASIIGSIKRSQRILGKIMTVSGVIVAFRKKALASVGLWDRDMITEDIAISWKLQKKFWDIRYEPNALCWMLVPETISGLWKQRVRWAQGGQEILFRHFNIFKDYRQRRLWPIYIEQVLSLVWSFLWLTVTIYLIWNASAIKDIFIWITFSSFALAMLSYIQLFISLRHENSYDNILKYYLWVAWYPVVYWMLNVFVAIAALPRSIKSRLKGGYAIWKSPDRGAIHDDIKEEDIEIAISEENTTYSTEIQSNKSLIVKSKQNILKRILGILISSIMWFYMLLVIYFFGSALFNLNDDFISILKVTFKVTNHDIRSFMMISVFIFILAFTILFLWRTYNIKRFGKLNRRKYPQNTTKENMIDLKLVDTHVYDMLQKADVITLQKNPIREL